jgi:hypothetical protein
VDGATLASGQQDVVEAPAGSVRPIASISAATPELAEAAKATLRVELTALGARLRNEWDFGLFPPKEAAPPENVLVADALDPAACRALAAGQRVLLLGSKPFPARPASFQMGLAGRPQGSLATVIDRHPLTDRFPHDGYCDWQFSKMLSGAAAVQLDDWAAAFDPIVEVVSSYKRVRRQAAVFEWRVGKGRLLVCSLSLPDADPAAAYFRHCLLAYAAGDQFQPRVQVSPGQLDQLLKGASPAVKPSAKPSQAFDQSGQLPG